MIHKMNITSIDKVTKQTAINYILLKYGTVLNTDQYYMNDNHNLSYSGTEIRKYFWPIVKKLNTLTCKLYKKETIAGMQITTYVSNKDNYQVFAHTHSHHDICTIKKLRMAPPNASWVYYLEVPNPCDMKLQFFDDNEEVIKEYLPVTDDLIIFDSNISHTPTKNNTENYRITLNADLLLS